MISTQTNVHLKTGAKVRVVDGKFTVGIAFEARQGELANEIQILFPDGTPAFKAKAIAALFADILSQKAKSAA